MFDDDSIEKARRDASRLETTLLRWLKKLRKRVASGNFTALDTLMQRGGGYLSRVIAGTEKIYLDRFLLALSALKAPWHMLVAALNPSPIPSPPPRGYLWALRQPKRKLDLLVYGDALSSWIESVAVEATAPPLSVDVGLIRSVMDDDSTVALDLAEAQMRALLTRASSTIPPADANQALNLLGILGDLYRLRGSFTTAIWFFERAFALERRICDLAGRSYLYRTSAYLLSDLGELDEAYVFAESAIGVSLATDGCDGLGQSMYVRAVMVDRRGDPTNAATLYQAALSQLGSATDAFYGAVHLAIAYAHLQNDRDSDAAASYRAAWGFIAQHGGIPAARLRSIGGELASRRGDRASADELFAEALEICTEHGTANDHAFIELSYARHVLRTDMSQARTLVSRVSRLVNEIDGNPVGEAAVLELLRQVARGTLSITLVTQTLTRLESPWRYLKAERHPLGSF